MKRVPRLGRIACGTPILADENIEGSDDVPAAIDCDFTLVCEGDSMIGARINDGDIVYVKIQEQVENGEIAAVRIGDETTLKRFYLHGDTVSLVAENPRFAPLVFVREQLNDLHVIGKAVAFTSVIR
jgi:repressor LexA